MVSSRKKKFLHKNNKTQKRVAGKMYGISGNVKLTFNGKNVVCEICKENNYKEKTGSFGKSKIRSGVGEVIFGDVAEVLDTTSVIIYICNNCGLCKVIRNKDPLLIKAESI